MKLEMFTFCDFAQDNNGKLTVVGTFDTIIARNFPCVHSNLTLVVQVRYDIWEYSEHEFRVEIRDLNGNMFMAPIAGTINVEGTGNATSVSHLIFSIAKIPFQRESVINFVLYIDEKEINSIPLYIRKMQ